MRISVHFKLNINMNPFENHSDKLDRIARETLVEPLRYPLCPIRRRCLNVLCSKTTTGVLYNNTLFGALIVLPKQPTKYSMKSTNLLMDVIWPKLKCHLDSNSI